MEANFFTSIQYLQDFTGVFVLALKRIYIPFCHANFSERFKNQYIYKLKTLLCSLADTQTVLPVIMDLTKYL